MLYFLYFAKTVIHLPAVPVVLQNSLAVEGTGNRLGAVAHSPAVVVDIVVVGLDNLAADCFVQGKQYFQQQFQSYTS